MTNSVPYNSKYILNDEADLLEAAAEELEKRSWTRGAFYQPATDAVCLVGAMSMALIGEETVIWFSPPQFYANTHHPLVEDAIYALVKQLHITPRYKNSLPIDAVTDWNDIYCKNKEEAIEALRTTAKIIREKE